VSQPAAGTAPKRAIGVVGLTFIAVSGVIGSGWLFAPLFAAQEAGPASILSWVLGGFMILIPALAFAEISAMLPVMGGIGRLPQFSHGSTVGMMIGWAAWVGYVTAAPIETQALLEYVSNEQMFSWLFVEIGETGQNPLSIPGIIVAFFLLVIFTFLNFFGVRLFTRINSGLTWIKIAVPLIAAIALLMNFDSAAIEETGFAPEGAEGILAAVASGGVIFAFLGFRHALDMAREADRPQRTVPIALIGSILLCMVLFVLVQIGFVGAVTPEQVSDGWPTLTFSDANGPIAAMLAGLGLAVVANLVLADAVVGPFGAALVASASTSRLTVAVSRNGLFPAFLQKMSDRGVPARALVMNAIVGMGILLVFRNGWQEILAFNSGAIVLSFCAGPIALLALRRQLPHYDRPFRLPIAGFIGALGFVVVGLIIYWTGWDVLWKLAIPLAFGLLLLIVRAIRSPELRATLDLREAAWLPPYIIGILLISWLGNFGGGLGIIPFGWDLLVVTVFSLGILALAVHLRLPADQVEAYLAADSADDLSPEPAPTTPDR
jgi:amino acid transporter